LTKTENGTPSDAASTDTLLGALTPPTREWFKSVSENYVLEEHHERILLLAGQSWDRAAEARERLDQEGLTVQTGQGSIKQHPLVRVEHEAREAFARLIKQLGLDDVEQPRRGPGRPGYGGIGITYEQLHGLPEPLPGNRRPRKRAGSLDDY
jgi:P27 family predicted phage terminase small subunit